MNAWTSPRRVLNLHAIPKPPRNTVRSLLRWRANGCKSRMSSTAPRHRRSRCAGRGRLSSNSGSEPAQRAFTVAAPHHRQIAAAPIAMVPCLWLAHTAQKPKVLFGPDAVLGRFSLPARCIFSRGRAGDGNPAAPPPIFAGMVRVASKLRSLPRWRIIRLKASPAVEIGTVEAPDADTAIQVAIKEFEITNPEHQRPGRTTRGVGPWPHPYHL